MDTALDPAYVPSKSDFSLNVGTVNTTGGSTEISTGGFSIGQFIIIRTTPFTTGEVITFSYTPNADPNKRLRGVGIGEVLPITNYSVTNNL